MARLYNLPYLDPSIISRGGRIYNLLFAGPIDEDRAIYSLGARQTIFALFPKEKRESLK